MPEERVGQWADIRCVASPCHRAPNLPIRPRAEPAGALLDTRRASGQQREHMVIMALLFLCLRWRRPWYLVHTPRAAKAVQTSLGFWSGGAAEPCCALSSPWQTQSDAPGSPGTQNMANQCLAPWGKTKQGFGVMPAMFYRTYDPIGTAANCRQFGSVALVVMNTSVLNANGWALSKKTIRRDHTIWGVRQRGSDIPGISGHLRDLGCVHARVVAMSGCLFLGGCPVVRK